MREKQVRKLPPWVICPDCGTTVRPFRVLERTDGRELQGIFECDCGKSRWKIYQRIEEK